MTAIQNSKFKSELISWGLVILGSFLFAVGDIMFANPYNLAPGGTWGLSNVLNALHPWKISFYVICMDIPLLIFGTWILGPKFGVKTVAATIFNIVFAFLLETTWGYFPIIHQGIYESIPAGMENLNLLVQCDYNTSLEAFGLVFAEGIDKTFWFMPDYLLNTIVAGLLYGIAIGLIFRAGATSGGSDIVSMVLHKYTKISLGTLVIIVDGIITFSTLLIGMLKGYDSIHDFTASLRLPINSFIVVFIEGIMIDIVVDGLKKFNTVFIVTDNPEPIRRFITEELNIGGVCFVGSGLHHGAEHKMIYTTLTRKQFQKLKSHLAVLDPDAVMNVVSSSEILGKKFKRLPDPED